MTTSIRIFQKQSSSYNSAYSNPDLRLPDRIHQLKSDESCLARVASQTTDEIQRQRSQGYNVPTTILIDPAKNLGEKSGLRLWRKLKKIKKRNPFDYRKNICGYITKKVIREFTSAEYREKAEQLCKKYKCDYNESKLYYASKIQHVTGPSHIPGLLVPESRSQLEFKLVFREFFQWFLRQHYLRYLLIEGKMSDKKAYIDYKNNTLLNMVNPDNIKYPTKVEHYAKKHNQCKDEICESAKQMPIIKIQPIIKIEPGMEEDQ